jgi:arginine-tRNA-protein transferase
MLSEGFRLINEEFYAERVLPEQMDSLLSLGWRHFGTQFFRYNIGILNNELRYVIPLRIRLSEFSFSKSQRRIVRRNSDLDVEIRPIEIDAEVEAMFERHKKRFDHSVPDSLRNFLSYDPAAVPCEAKEIRVTLDGRLLATSYFDLGQDAASGIYAVFEPTVTDRSLGIFTMLKEIEYSIETGREFYYQGYCYAGSSFYDYKKRFRGTEAFNWDSNWTSFREA